MAVRLGIGPGDLLATDTEVLDAMLDLLQEQDRKAEREARVARWRAMRR